MDIFTRNSNDFMKTYFVFPSKPSRSLSKKLTFLYGSVIKLKKLAAVSS
jgi:hypothetical protein